MKRTFTLPDPGEGLIEAEIVEWQVAVGDTVTVNQVLVEVETSKSLVELPSPWAGTVVELLAQVGETIAVGSPIVTIDDGVVTEGALAEGVVAEQAAPEDGAAGSGGGAAERSTAGSGEPAAPVAHEGSGPTLVGYGAAPSATTRRRRVGRGAGRAASPERDAVSTAAVPAAVPAAAVPAAASPVAAVAAAAVPAAASTTARPRSAPIVRRLARDLGVDLAVVTPTRPDGIITRDDVLALAEHTQPSSTRPVETPAPDARVNARVPLGSPLRTAPPTLAAWHANRSAASGGRWRRRWSPRRSPLRMSPSSSPST
ncbi:biotin/lipoyl-containing protein [Kribbia dieselivorans]|uniref:biotin/lipoyl-containing protein n=1 Tax=Kribbia dieselivorans TaxID=331526 RepID=UPI001C3F4B1B|nr:biotin/lipoyl-containing protein [Kribbia dieselivorans]